MKTAQVIAGLEAGTWKTPAELILDALHLAGVPKDLYVEQVVINGDNTANVILLNANATDRTFQHLNLNAWKVEDTVEQSLEAAAAHEAKKVVA